MTRTYEFGKRKRALDRDGDMRTKLFYLFLIAQICSLFGLVVGTIFFIVRLLRMF